MKTIKQVGFKQWLLCEVLGWHFRPRLTHFDGCSQHATCSLCSRDVMQDSQGNWF